MKTYTFYKTETGRWFVSLPLYLEQGGSQEDLEMVDGADVFLDLLAEGDGRVRLAISDQYAAGFEILSLVEKADNEIGGAYYFLDHYQQIDFGLRMWLCDVTKWIFGDFPGKIYFKRVATGF